MWNKLPMVLIDSAIALGTFTGATMDSTAAEENYEQL